MITIAIVQRNGGVGKTTLAFSLAGAFAKAGKRVCVVDLDPQADLTGSFMGTPWTKALPLEKTAAALFDPSRFVPPEELVAATALENIAIVPGAQVLEEYEKVATHPDRQFVIRRFVCRLAFDYVLIDCPPNMYALTAAALCAAQFALVPTRANRKGVESIHYVASRIEMIEATVNPQLQLLGYVLGDHKEKNPTHIAYATDLQAEFGPLLFDNFIPRSPTFETASHKQKPMSFFRPRGKPAAACEAVAAEIDKRIGQGRGVSEAA